MTVTIEGLKEQARRFEQDEEWRKALDLYIRAIGRLADDERPDIGLHNRVGDLCTRVGEVDRAVEHYETAVDLYEEAGLPNNAIAVCKKIIRNVPNRHRVFLHMGLIRARQGFLVDARQCFLTYAERMTSEGDREEALRALAEFADLVPDDIEIRLVISAQFEQHGHPEEALAQLSAAYAVLVSAGDTERAAEVGEKIHALDAGADLDELASPGDHPAGFETSSLVEVDVEAGSGEALDAMIVLPAEPDAPPAEVATDLELALGVGAEEPSSAVSPREHDGDDLIGEVSETAGEAVADLPLIEGTEAFVDLRADVEAAGIEADARTEDALAGGALDEVEMHQRRVESAFRGSEQDLVDAYLGLADALDATGARERARSVYQQVLALDPDNGAARAGVAHARGEERPTETAPEVASSEEYVDLGALVLGDDDEKTTRFVVAYEEPSGDEDADFARMLTQFKEKVAENVDPSDVRAHHDLGTAYREMGLLDEAIEEFQKALRASADHLPTFELLGQAFIEQGAEAAAVRVLSRALEAPYEVEDELLGIYYHLGRAHEALGHRTEAVEFYDRVFALDINFADVTERLRALR
jgi:tetratricopeptide (TPR) repeat protein